MQKKFLAQRGFYKLLITGLAKGHLTSNFSKKPHSFPLIMGYSPTWFLLACVPIYKQSLPNPIWPNLDFMAFCPYSTQCPSKAYLAYLGCQVVQVLLHAESTWTSWPCTESYIDCVPNLLRDFLIYKPGGQFFREPIPSWPWGMMWDVRKIKIHFVFFVLPKKPKSKKSIFFEGRTVSRIEGTSLFLCLNTTKCFFKKIF